MAKSIQRVVSKAKTKDAKDRERAKTADSFQNLAAKLGMGTDNLISSSSYGFNPISRIRQLLEWIHRGSWLGGVAVDLVADDMTRAGIKLLGVTDPAVIEAIEEIATTLAIWEQVADLVKWGRLYGGSIAVNLLDGQDVSEPFRVDRTGPNQYRGMFVLDRWQLEPSLNDLVQEYGPDLGRPKYYRVATDAPALSGERIHYSRCIRFEGVKLPYWQRMAENLWGISVLERLYDRMVAFDSATTGAAQLVYKSYLRTIKVKDMRQLTAMGGDSLNAFARYLDMMRRFQSIEGLTVIDAEDDFQEGGANAFSGLADALVQFGQQLSGALQIPLVRLFGQSPAGLNSTGESDLKTYYDMILAQQQRHLKVPLTRVYRAIALSLRVRLPQGFGIKFNPLWQLTDEQKASIANTVSQAVGGLEGSGTIKKSTALKELRQSAETTGYFSNIEDSEIEEADLEPPPGMEGLGLPGEEPEAGTGPEGQGDPLQQQSGSPKAGKGADSAEFEESKHPRKDDGKFAPKGQGGGGAAAGSSSGSGSGTAVAQPHPLPEKMKAAGITKGSHKTVQSFSIELLKTKKYTNQEIADAAKHFFGGKTTASSVAWYWKIIKAETPEGKAQAAAKQQAVKANDTVIHEAEKHPMKPAELNKVLAEDAKKSEKTLLFKFSKPSGGFEYYKVHGAPDDSPEVKQVIKDYIVAAKEIKGTHHWSFTYDPNKPATPAAETKSVILEPNEIKHISDTVYKKAEDEKKANALKNKSDVTTVNTKPFTQTQLSCLKGYTNGTYRELNKRLRQAQPLDEKLANIAANIDGAIRSSEIKESGFIYRGISAVKEFFGPSITAGTTVMDHGFASCSKRFETAKGFSASGYVIRIKVKKGDPGVDVSSFSHHPGESEIVLPRGSLFKIENVVGKIVEVSYVS